MAKLRDALKGTSKKTEEKPQEDLHYAEEGDGDNSPVVHSLAVKTTHPSKDYLQTELVANIHGPTGLVSKRTVIPGGITAAKLAALLEGVADW
jgi:hypothetical protein